MCERCTQQTVVTGQPTRVWVHAVGPVSAPLSWVQEHLLETERALMHLASTHEHPVPAAIGSALVLVQAAREEVKRARQAQEATR